MNNYTTGITSEKAPWPWILYKIIYDTHYNKKYKTDNHKVLQVTQVSFTKQTQTSRVMDEVLLTQVL